MVSAAQKRERQQLVHRWVRRAVQLAFFVLAPALFSGAFNGVKYFFTQIGLVAGIELTSFVVLLLAVLLFTVVFGRFFCGYACAFGTLGDYLYAAFEFVRSKTPIPRIEFPSALVKAFSLLKYVVLALICAACVLGVWSSYSGYSPWVAFAGVLSGSFGELKNGAFVVLGLVVLGMVVRERFFCQFLCPLGAVFSLLPVLGVSEYTRKREHCAKSCGRCREACPVGIWPDGDSIGHGECIACGRCADVCPMNNVNLVALEKGVAKRERLAAEAARAEKDQAVKGLPETDAGELAGDQAADAGRGVRVKGSKPTGAARPLRKTPDKWYLLRGTGVGVTLGKAAVLLAVCWIVGATRYLPPFSEVSAYFGTLF